MGIKHSPRGPMQGSIWRDVCKGRYRKPLGDDWNDFNQTSSGLDRLVRESDVFDVSNVIRYIQDPGHSPSALDEYPCIAPVSDLMWFEGSLEDGKQVAQMWVSGRLFDGGGWTVGVTNFLKHFTPDSDSHAISHGTLKIYPDGVLKSANAVADSTDRLAHVLGFPIDSRMWLTMSFTALSFIHCKNVVTSTHNLIETKKRRERDDRAGIPKLTFKTISIVPVTAKRVGNEMATAHSDRAFHICRGHFAEYSAEKPLFGKYTGRFWIAQHARGSKAAGIVQKDYKVKT